MGFAQALSEHEEALGGDQENTETQGEGQSTRNIQWN